jgi:hypothetical protein
MVLFPLQDVPPLVLEVQAQRMVRRKRQETPKLAIGILRTAHHQNQVLLRLVFL